MLQLLAIPGAPLFLSPTPNPIQVAAATPKTHTLQATVTVHPC